jgi:hypothetical protein
LEAPVHLVGTGSNRARVERRFVLVRTDADLHWPRRPVGRTRKLLFFGTGLPLRGKQIAESTETLLTGIRPDGCKMGSISLALASYNGEEGASHA